jgi:hypothetical protein
MGKVGGAGLVLAGIILAIFGWFLQSGLLEWLLEKLGWSIVVIGAVLGVVGLIKIFSGGGNGGGSSDDF